MYRYRALNRYFCRFPQNNKTSLRGLNRLVSPFHRFLSNYYDYYRRGQIRPIDRHRRHYTKGSNQIYLRTEKGGSS